VAPPSASPSGEGTGYRTRPGGPRHPLTVAHPFHEAAIVGVANTEQARSLPGHDSLSIALEGALAALADAGLRAADVDGVVGERAGEVVYELRLGPCRRSLNGLGIPAVLEAAALVATRQCQVVLVVGGSAGVYTDRASTAPWTRPTNEFVVGYGMFTAVEFALMAKRHMLTFGTTPEQLAMVAATIRNNGHLNPQAVYTGRGPFTPEDILASRSIAEPFHLLDCSTTSEGGCALVVTTADRAAELAQPPSWILGGGSDAFGPSYQHGPIWDFTGARGDDLPAGYVGRRAAERAFATAGLGPDDVDVCELYDPFSFEIIRQLEAFGFCPEGEGGPFVASGAIGPGGRFPVTTDGGTMSFAHPGNATQMLQRVIRGVEQVRGSCRSAQVPGAEVALCSNGGSGALFNDVLLVGSGRP
jgi:acetyl-CoA acetyltransferase